MKDKEGSHEVEESLEADRSVHQDTVASGEAWQGMAA
jgi:hypothetical protein